VVTGEPTTALIAGFAPAAICDAASRAAESTIKLRRVILVLELDFIVICSPQKPGSVSRADLKQSARETNLNSRYRDQVMPSRVRLWSG
jgi:hypothetical protein